MVTFKCRTCGEVHELSFGSPDGWFWCDDACQAQFADVVEHLVAGGDPEAIDIQPGSVLFREAVREVEARRQAEGIYIRDQREAEYRRNRPRPLKALYPC